jgi:pimeloyl-ACP methyl ester carboxylesterase
MPTVKTHGIDLYYEVHGEGAPILGIHGTPSSALLWVDAARELANHGRCIIYDRRGFFRSAPFVPSETMDLSEHVDDAATLIGAVTVPPAVVIGRSTGGQIALALAHRFPDKVRALVLLEPALFTVDPEAMAWAERLRLRALQAATDNPFSVSEVIVREVLGDQAWESFPAELKELFAEAGPAVLAEMRGQGLDLSEKPFHLGREELAGMAQPTLIVSGEDSPEAMRRVNDRLAEALPNAEKVLVSGGHLINPAHPEVLSFIDRVLTMPETSRKGVL